MIESGEFVARILEENTGYAWELMSKADYALAAAGRFYKVLYAEAGLSAAMAGSAVAKALKGVV